MAHRLAADGFDVRPIHLLFAVEQDEDAMLRRALGCDGLPWRLQSRWEDAPLVPVHSAALSTTDSQRGDGGGGGGGGGGGDGDGGGGGGSDSPQGVVTAVIPARWAALALAPGCREQLARMGVVVGPGQWLGWGRPAFAQAST